MHYVVARLRKTIPPIHKYHPNNTQMPDKYHPNTQIPIKNNTNTSQIHQKWPKNTITGLKWSEMFREMVQMRIGITPNLADLK